MSKKNNVVVDSNDENTVDQNIQAKDTRGGETSQVATAAPMTDHNSEEIPAQILQNLPHELLTQPRFFKVGADKNPHVTAWSNPQNQTLYTVIQAGCLAGFDTCGHGQAANYCLVDFDHVLGDDGNFVNTDAEKWFNLLAGYETYCEKSISGHGLHFLFRPTPDKFQAISGGKRGTLHFGGDAKAEIFYLSKARYCLLTGDLYQCEPKAPIVSGELADDALQKILDEIERRNPTPKQPARFLTDISPTAQDSADYDLFRAQIMLDCIVPANLEDSDWLAVISAAKNIGIDYATVDAFNHRDPDRYNETENKTRWDSLDDPSFDIATLHGIAKRFGYMERDSRRQWYNMHPESKPSAKRIADKYTKRELDDAIIWLESLDTETFTVTDARSNDSIHKVALAAFYNFHSGVENFFNVLKAAKTLSKTRLKDDDANEFSQKLPKQERLELTALAEGVDVTYIRRAVDREITQVKKSHEYFQKSQAALYAEKLAEEREAERAAKKKANEERIKELQEMPLSKEHCAEIIEKIRNACEWRCDRQGNEIAVKGTAANINLILSNDPYLKDLFGYDEFQQADVFLKAPPWNPNAKKGDEWTDSDDSQLRMYLRDTYTEFANKALVDDATVKYSQAHKFHEVKEMFSRIAKKWDRKKRAGKIFIKFLGAEDTPYTEEVTLNWLTAAVARIYHPGCDYQLAPILLGEQGIGKSYVLNKLGGKWYGSLVDDVSDPHAIDAIQKLWIVEIKEMAAMKKDIDANKRFIDSARDTRRKAYERRATTVPRHCVFMITTNNKMCLTDMTGNRRYPIIVCNNKSRHYVEGLTQDYIDQVWAEVFNHCLELFADGFDESKLQLSRDAQIKSDEIAEDYLRDDGMESEIRAYLDIKILPLILWYLLTREERRDFIKNGRIVMNDALSEFNHRRRAKGGKDATVQHDVDLITSCLSPAQNKHWLRIDTLQMQGRTVDQYILYGSELREHICAVEIYNECFGNDKRKTPTRINEILNRIEGWSLGADIARDDPAYLRQRKVFYRDKE